MNTSIRRPLFFVIALTVLLSTACEPGQIKKAKAASKTIATLVDTGLRLIPSFQEQGLIDDREARAATEALADLKLAIDEFNRRAAGYKEFNPKAKADLARAFADVTAALAVLNSDGVLRIKNSKLRGRVQIGLTTLNLAAQQIELVLQPE